MSDPKWEKKKIRRKKKRIELPSAAVSHPPSILPQISFPNVTESRYKRSFQNVALLDGAGRSVDVISLEIQMLAIAANANTE